MKLTTLRERVLPITVKFLDEPVEFGIRPGAITQQAINAMYSYGLGPSDDEALKVWVDVIAYWDILDDDGKRIPVSVDVLKQLPVALISQIPHELNKELESQGKA